MPYILYGLKNCDTCKKALKALEAAGKPTAFVDIREDTDLQAKVPQWLASAGTNRLLNTRSTTWRNLNEAERGQAPEKLLIANPTLIKRPVIETGKTVYVGWTTETQADLL